MAVSASSAVALCSSLVPPAPEPTCLSIPPPSPPLLLSPPLLPIGRTWKKDICGQCSNLGIGDFWDLDILIYACCKRHNLHSEIEIIKYLLSTDKKRRAVLVYKLVAAVGVDMSHFCAVNVKGHLVRINSQSSRVHGWASTQDLSEGSRTGRGTLQ